MKIKDIKKAFKETYGKQMKTRNAYRGASNADVNKISQSLGYTQTEINAVPEGSNLGLGCGNPVAFAAIKVGETVLDLGCGAGFDCFLVAQQVGPNGKVIGVDMTKEMIIHARANAQKSNYQNVEFRHGEIEALSIDDESVDLIISNCVITLSPDKDTVFKEIFRTLKPGGRMIISDLVLLTALPAFIRNSMEINQHCFVALNLKKQYLNTIEEAGFQDVKVINETPYPLQLIDFNDPTAQSMLQKMNLSKAQTKQIHKKLDVVSIIIRAAKPIKKNK